MLTELHSLYLQAPIYVAAGSPSTVPINEAEITDKLGGVWVLLSGAMQAIGALIVIFGLIKIGMKAMQGKAQGAFKESIVLLLVGAFMFNIGLVFTIMAGSGSIVTAILDAFTGVAGAK